MRERSLTSAFVIWQLLTRPRYRRRLVRSSASPTAFCSARLRPPSRQPRSVSPSARELLAFWVTGGAMRSSVMRTRGKWSEVKWFEFQCRPQWARLLVLEGLWVGCKIRLFTGRCRFLSFGYLCFLLEVCLCVTRISSSVCSSTYVRRHYMRCEEDTWDTIVEDGEEVVHL